METHHKSLGLELPEDRTMAMMMMKMTRMMTGGKVGMIRLLQIKEDGTRDPQTPRERNTRLGFLAY